LALAVKTMMTGAHLVEAITHCSVKPGQVALWWLGQSGFALKFPDCTVYVDLYLSGEVGPTQRLLPPPFAPESVSNADVILCSHDHPDHLDAASISAIMEASPRAKLVLPEYAAALAVSCGVPPHRLQPLLGEDRLEFGNLRIWAIPACHETLEYSEEYGHRFLSYVLRDSEVVLWHAGDGIPYEGLRDYLGDFALDLALIPINGRDAERRQRGIEGNFTFKEAADLAARLRARLVIPMHYGMFAGNTERVERFVEYLQRRHPRQRYAVLEPFQRYLFEVSDGSFVS